ncbi:cutinase family protein [Actinomycetospora sp. CA-053990]|uniref:cutinase family protein n=1 Tax=Actinomycetospora sp. CA-053990 TaxID=3239891 RepID=UPI003D91A853
MSRIRVRPAHGVVVAALVLLLTGCGGRPPVAPTATGCAPVEIAFARGTSQPPGLGRIGDAFARAVVAAMPPGTVRARGVEYPAAGDQDVGSGVVDVVEHTRAVVAACPGTVFVLGGYSQGAVLISAALGLPAGDRSRGLPVLDAAVVARTAAVVVFGNPLGSRGTTLETAPSAVRDRALDLCTTGDAICGRRGPLLGTHRSYDEGATDRAAAFAVGHLTSTPFR